MRSCQYQCGNQFNCSIDDEGVQEISSAGPYSAVLYGHSFPPCTFSSVSLSSFISSRCRCLCVRVRQVSRPVLFFFVTCSILCFHVCKTTQLSSYTLTRNTSLPPNHLSPRLHTTYSPLPCIINHERQYMFIHRHLTVRILDGVIREAVIYVHPI